MGSHFFLQGISETQGSNLVRSSLVAQLVKNLPARQETPVRFLGQKDSPGKGIGYPLQYSWASLVAQWIKNLPAVQETWVPSLGWEDPLEEDVATHSSILAWRIPMDRGTWRATVHGVAKSLTQLSDFMFTLKTLMLIEISKSKRTNTVWFCVLGTQRSQTGRNSWIMIARARGLGRRLNV